MIRLYLRSLGIRNREIVDYYKNAYRNCHSLYKMKKKQKQKLHEKKRERKSRKLIVNMDPYDNTL